MISYLKKLLKQNDSVKIHLIDGSVSSPLHIKKGNSNRKCQQKEDHNNETNINRTYIVQIES